MKKLQAKLDRAVPGHLNRIISSSADEDAPAGVERIDGRSRRRHLYDRKTNHRIPSPSPFPGLGGKRLAPMRAGPGTRRATGSSSAAIWHATARPRSDSLPLIVMPHGGPFACDSWGYDPWVQYLGEQGLCRAPDQFRDPPASAPSSSAEAWAMGPRHAGR